MVTRLDTGYWQAMENAVVQLQNPSWSRPRGQQQWQWQHFSIHVYIWLQNDMDLFTVLTHSKFF